MSDSTPAAARPRPTTFDWLCADYAYERTSFQNFIFSVDYSKSLGPIAGWSPQLRGMVLMVEADPTPAVIYWGPKSYVIYNEAYCELIGQKHPNLQGQDPTIEFAEFWQYFADLIAEQRQTGKTRVEANQKILLLRHGFLEEAYFSWKVLPVFGDDGTVVASYNTVFETSKAILGERRTSAIRNLSREISSANDTSSLWVSIQRGLDLCVVDVPFVGLYAVSSDSHEHPTSVFELKVATGVCESSGQVLPKYLNVGQDDLWLAQTIRRVHDTFQPVLLDPYDGVIPASVSKTIEEQGSNKLVVYPVQSTYTNDVLAYVVIGLSSNHAYDDDYKNFIHLLHRQISTPLIVLWEEAARRRSAAAQDALAREKLSQELSASEIRFERFASQAQIGLAILNPDGTVDYANRLWHEMTQLEFNSRRIDWGNAVVAEDLELTYSMFDKLVKDRQPSTFSLRFQRPWMSPDRNELGQPIYTPTHILCSLHPNQDADGRLTTINSCLTDVSELKYIEAKLRSRMDQAILMKQQQEKLVDFISHEIRNPLSAMLSCADTILSNLSPYASKPDNRPNASLLNSVLPALRSELDDCVEAADTIVYCAMHQKRIVDDILTLSRLDSDLLIISPERIDIVQLVSIALKMFDIELARANMSLKFIQHPSLEHLKVKWTLLDPSRVLQILINLITNSIKFTRKEEIREITVTLSASSSEPSSTDGGIKYIPRSSTWRDHTLGSEFGSEELLYLSLAVSDTGCGLSDEEQLVLFNVFQQASPKTSVRYGGSGLGLYISRQMTEMQGGQIGVHSIALKGSTFKFFIKARRTDAPTNSAECTEANPIEQFNEGLSEACDSQLGGPVPGADVTSESASTLTAQPNPEKVILVIEDNILNQKVVSKQLQKAGCVVHVANHGEEGLDFLRRSKYWLDSAENVPLSVVLMDLEMPVMDGITCVKRIRELQRSGQIKGHVPVIAVTANARKDQIEAAKLAGMDDVTTKPYRIQQILKQIEDLVSRIDSAKFS